VVLKSLDQPDVISIDLAHTFRHVYLSTSQGKYHLTLAVNALGTDTMATCDRRAAAAVLLVVLLMTSYGVWLVIFFCVVLARLALASTHAPLGVTCTAVANDVTHAPLGVTCTAVANDVTHT
jgi:hypothetical protein